MGEKGSPGGTFLRNRWCHGMMDHVDFRQEVVSIKTGASKSSKMFIAG